MSVPSSPSHSLLRALVSSHTPSGRSEQAESVSGPARSTLPQLTVRPPDPVLQSFPLEPPQRPTASAWVTPRDPPVWNIHAASLVPLLLPPTSNQHPADHSPQNPQGDLVPRSRLDPWSSWYRAQKDDPELFTRERPADRRQIPNAGPSVRNQWPTAMLSTETGCTGQARARGKKTREPGNVNFLPPFQSPTCECAS